MAKKITAPKTYDPGKGRPKEHLAYLNAREMQYLRSINGNNMERGPRGLPSFPPDDSLGSNSGNSKPTGGGSKGPGGPSGPNSGPSGGLGGGGKGGTSSPSAGSKSPTSNAPKASTSSPSSKPAASSPKTPTSPMGGQGTSFRSPMGAGWSNRDFIDRQKAQVNDTRSAIKNTPAARSDLALGGIRTLNVGPMGTPVKVGGSPTVGTKQFYDRVPQISAPRPSVSGVPNGMKYSSPLTPGMTPEDMARRGAIMDKYEREIRDLMRGTPTRTGDPISAGGIPTASAPKRSGYSGASFDSESEAQQTAIDRALINTSIARSIGPVSKPASSTSSVFSSAQAATPGAVDLAGTGYGTFNVPDVEFENRFREAMKPDISVDAPPSPFGDDERIISVENYDDPSIKQSIADESVYTMGLHGYPKEQMLRPGMYGDPNAPETISKSIAEAANRRMDGQPRIDVVGGTGIMAISSPEASETVTSADLSASQRNKVYGSPISPGKTRGISESDFENSAVSGVEDDVYGPKNVSPEVQEVMADIEKKNKYGTRVMKTIGRPLAALDAVRGLITGKNTAEADADLKRAYMQGSAAQKAELEREYPNLTKFAQQAGLEPQLPMSNYESWRQRSFGTGGGGGVASVTSAGGGTPDIGSGGKAERRWFEAMGQPQAEQKKPKDEAGSRPAIYYKWDLGIDIPSPGDSGYNLYLKYLDEKAGQA